jgi:hypothetical protein
MKQITIPIPVVLELDVKYKEKGEYKRVENIWLETELFSNLFNLWRVE